MTPCTSRSIAARRDCGPRALDWQPYPRMGRLARQCNYDLDALRTSVGEGEAGATVYAYVVATVENRDGWFAQRGSAPNWQGGILTLTTCKHRMRTFRRPGDWMGVWVAGFTGVAAGGGANALVFLTRIASAWPSHAVLWRDAGLSAATKRAKDATLYQLGDLYRPAENGRGAHDSRAYVAPGRAHAHAPGGAWRGDITYKTEGHRRPALLVGDPAHTYLYERPLVFYDRQTRLGIGQGQRKHTLYDLLALLSAKVVSSRPDSRDGSS